MLSIKKPCNYSKRLRLKESFTFHNGVFNADSNRIITAIQTPVEQKQKQLQQKPQQQQQQQQSFDIGLQMFKIDTRSNAYSCL